MPYGAHDVFEVYRRRRHLVSTSRNGDGADAAQLALPNTNRVRVYNYPVIAVDNSDGAYAGSLYVAMYTWTGKVSAGAGHPLCGRRQYLVYSRCR